uniref:Uncharacterized protein n=1 Tax=Oryza rufipogon TaxID=4529 RepID=A0A0E0RAI4_ORYRU
MLAVGSSCAALRCAVHSSPTPSTNPPPPRRRFHRFSRRRDGRRRDAPLPSSASSGHGLAATSSFPGSSSPSAHWRRAASSPGTSPPPRRTEEAAVGVRRRRRIPGLAAEVEQRALAGGRDAAVLEFYSPWLRLCASLQGLVRELEDGAGGWTGFAIADAEDDRWLAECWGRGVAAHWVSAAGSVKPEPLEMGGGRQGAGEAQRRCSLVGRMGGTQIKWSWKERAVKAGC